MSEEGDFLQKFGYRSYSGGRKGRIQRILDIIGFEVRTTWDRSTFGKVLLIIVLVLNAILILIASTISIGGQGPSDDAIRAGLSELVANYLNFAGNPLTASTEETVFAISVEIGFLLIALFAIAGSGLFADDKEGKVVEIYLSRVDKIEYITGKVGSIIVYTNLFLMVPLLLTSILLAQSYGVNHLDYIGFYVSVVMYSFLASMILGLLILCFSIMVEKRSYASLGYFLIYVLGGIFGYQIYQIDPSNELLLLVSPEIFLSLLAYVVLGDFELGISEGFFGGTVTPLNLNDGHGLEYWHVLGLAGIYIVITTLFLAYKIKKLTTEEL